MLIIDLPLEDPDPIVPHPDLTAAQRPTPLQVFDAARHLGWFPAEPFLRPVVPAPGQEAAG